MLGPLGLFFELLPELEQEVVDGSQGTVVVGPPDGGLDLLAGEYVALGIDQAEQHVELGGGEFDQGAIAEYLAGGAADQHVREAHLVGGGAEARLAAEHGLDAGQQLGQPEGLGHVVLGAELEAHDLVHLGAAGAEHHHGGEMARLAQVAEDLEAVELGEHHVEDDQVKRLGAGEGQTVLAVGGEGHVVPLGREVHL